MKPGILQSLSIKGTSPINEDALVVNDKKRLFAVIDGVTSLVPYLDEQGHTGGYKAANLLASFLEQVSDTVTLADKAVEANACLRSLMVDADVDIENKENLWGAAFVAIRVHDYQIEYVQAGDCMLLARYDDGTLRVITRNQVECTDVLSLRKRKEALSLGITDPKTIREFVLPVIKQNRITANTMNGYSVLNGDPQFNWFLESGRINRMGLTRLYLLTDGLFSPTLESWDQRMDYVDKFGLNEYAKSIIQLEQDDPDCKKYIRHKVSDDKTGIVIDL